MTRVAIDVAHRSDDIEAAEWDDLCGEHPFVRHRWLRLAEGLLTEHEPRYVLARRDGRLDAAAILSIGRRFKHQTLQRRLGWALRLFPLMRCGAPLSASPGLLLGPRHGSFELVPSIVAAIRGQAVSHHALFLTYGQSSPDDPRWSALAAGGFHQYGRQSEMYLPISWPSTSAYLASMSGSDRRKISKLQRRAEREGILVERDESPQRHAARLRELIGNVLLYHGTRDSYARDFVERGQAVCGDSFQVLTAWRAGEIIGCAIALREGDSMTARWIGLDYARSWGTSAYRLLMFRIIELAIEEGVRSLSLGPTASATKEDFGALAREQFSALAVLAPIPATLVESAAQLVAGRAAVDPTYSSARARSSPALPG
jgi:predicted N-acyltransferase